jgi:hypothetical protein
MSRRFAIAVADVACLIGITIHPFQQVGLDTGYAHVLVLDPAIRGQVAETLDRAHRLSARYGLAHQRRSIESLTVLAQPGTRPGPTPDGGRP